MKIKSLGSDNRCHTDLKVTGEDIENRVIRF